jgi:hypothetical protein
MNKTTFYEKALPTRGVYCVTTISPDKEATNRFAESLPDLINIIESYDKTHNVFVAMSSFTGFSRKASSALSSRSFFIDLDVGVNKPFNTKDVALVALEDFLKKSGAPDPVIVDSGGGLHAYWLFDRDVPIAEWKHYADKFKAYCLSMGLGIDPVVTADASRIMRSPDTLNLKKDPPSPTRILPQSNLDLCDFGDFKEFLGVDAAPVDDILATIPKGLDEDTKAIASQFNYESVFEEIAARSVADGTGCAQIKYILENAATLEEPLWHSGLSIARNCIDYDTAIHAMSEDYPGYSRDETIRKADETIDKPHSCEVFDSRRPGICSGCPHRGKITNPLALGRRLREAPPAPHAVRFDADPEKIFAFPDFLKPFTRGLRGGVFYRPKPVLKEDGTRVQEDPIELITHDMYPLKRVVGTIEGDCLLVRHVLPKDPTKEFTLPLTAIASMDQLKTHMGKNGEVISTKQIQLVSDYFSRWVKYFQQVEAAEIMRGQMGWTEERDAFVLGASEILETGVERPSAASPMTRNISKLVRRFGDYGAWKQSANALNMPGFELHCLGLLMGFGSPLMNYTSTPGAVICFFSSESGYGKSGALYAGLSVFSDPYNISVLESASTDNAYTGRYLALKNLMFGIDEAGNLDPLALSKLIHKIAQGKAKMRMQSSVNAEREIEQPASLLAGMSTNQSLYDKLYSIKGKPEGEIARVIEFPMKKPPQLDADPNLGIKIFDPFRYNYGHAGPDYVKFLFAKGDAYIREKIAKWTKQFGNDYGTDTSYRFYANAISSCFAGGEMAVEAGIIDMDIARVYRIIIRDMIQIRDKTVKFNAIDYKDLLTNFYYSNIDKFLILNDGRITSEPRGNLIGRVEVDNQAMYISRSEFKKYLATIQISGREFEVALEHEQILVEIKKLRLSSGWRTGTASTPPISCYHFRSVPDDLLVKDAAP